MLRCIYLLILFSPIAFFAQEINRSNDEFIHVAKNKGGKNELKRIFKQEVYYPEQSLKNKIKGTVAFQFIVMADGSVQRLHKTDSVNGEIDAEALRIFKLLEFEPSVSKGDSVNSYVDVKFRFNPIAYRKIVRERGYDKMVFPGNYIEDPSMKIHTLVDEQPVYPEGNYALDAFIQKNLVYPQVARIQKIKGTVLIRFIVEPSGYPTNIHVVRSLGFGCDEEAIRLLSLIKWKPATKEGQPVRSRMDFPLAFDLNEQFRDNSLGEQKY